MREMIFSQKNVSIILVSLFLSLFKNEPLWLKSRELVAGSVRTDPTEVVMARLAWNSY